MAIKAFEGCLLAVGMWHNHQTARKLKEMKKLLHFAFPINQDQGVGREEICERFPQLESPWSTPSASWERILLQCAAKDFLHHQRCFPNYQYFCDVLRIKPRDVSIEIFYWQQYMIDLNSQAAISLYFKFKFTFLLYPRTKLENTLGLGEKIEMLRFSRVQNRE